MVVALVILSVGMAEEWELSADPRKLRSELAESLVEQLGSADPKRGRQLADRLVRLGRTAVPALLKALKDPRLQVRFYAASALDLIGGPAATEALLAVLSDEKEDPLVRRIAAQAMGRAEHKPALPVLMTLARKAYETREGKQEDGDEAFRFEVVRAIAWIAPAEAEDVLIAALGDPSWRIREAAAQGLGDGRVVSALDHLKKALADPEGAVAVAAARAIGKLGPASFAAVEDLIEALGRPDARLRRAVTGALVIATGRNFSTQDQWREWWKARKEGSAGEQSGQVRPSSGGFMSGRIHEEPDPSGKDKPIPPALRPPWDWDGEDWRQKSSE